VSIKDNEGLTITGAVDVVTGTISTPFGSEPIGALTLVSTGTLSESGAGRIEAGTLMGSSVGGATLNGANLITTIGSFANAGFGDIGLTNNQTLTVAGPLNAGTGNLALTATAGNLLINGTVEGNTVTFGSTLGSVTGPGPITAAVLNVTANTGIDLTGPNEITTIGTNDTNSGPDFINQ
jgi:fibronectin-binding autotransporter adhesin